jgi:hypothetical protein
MIEVDVWVRGTLQAQTRAIHSLPEDTNDWTDADVRTLLAEMLLALEREKNPDGDPPEITLRGFSWIVSPYESRGVLVHLDLQLGTVSAGPLAIDEQRLTGMVARVMAASEPPQRIH